MRHNWEEVQGEAQGKEKGLACVVRANVKCRLMFYNVGYEELYRERENKQAIIGVTSRRKTAKK